jgi:hypothetical protein
MHYRAIFEHGQPFARESFTAKQKNGLEQHDFFSYFECFRSKDLPI